MGNKSNRVAIIGAGVSGVAAAKHFRSAGLEVVVYERSSVCGGNWAYDERKPLEPAYPSVIPSMADFVVDSDDETSQQKEANGNGVDSVKSIEEVELRHAPPGPAYSGLTNNVATSLQELKGYPWKEGTGDFVNVRVIGEYIQGYARHFGVEPLIRYNTRVEKLQKKGMKWVLRSNTLMREGPEKGTSHYEVDEFDAVAVASGHYHACRVPDIPGLQEWKAAWPDRVQHSKGYRKPDDFKGQNVLIIGGGVSSLDIAREISHTANEIYQSVRGGEFDLPIVFLPEHTERVGEVASFEIPSSPESSPGAITLVDGRVLHGIERVVLATGYHITYPFLRQYHNDSTAVQDADETVLVTEGIQVHNLHRDIFYIPDPTLAFIGAPYYIATFSFFEYQAILVAAVFSGRAWLPSKAEMQKEYRDKVAKKGYGRTFHSLKDEEIEYVKDLVGWVNSHARVTEGPVYEPHSEAWVKEHGLVGLKIKAMFERKNISVEIKSYWTGQVVGRVQSSITMYLPRSLLSTLYLHLQRSHHPLSPPVLILVALEPDALCGCRILTNLLKSDYIPHKIQPIAGYGDLQKAGKNVIRPMMESQGGSGGVVVCLGVGGLTDLGALLGIEGEGDEAGYSGVEIWVVDARRPWNLGNVFGGFPILEIEGQKMPGVDGGKIERGYKPGKGGIIVFDDGDIEEDLGAERDAYLALVDMPEIEDNGDDSDGSETESDDGEDPAPTGSLPGQKRKSWSDRDEEDESSDDDRPRQRRKSNSSSPIPDSPSRAPKRGLMSLNGPPMHSSDRSVSPTPAQLPKAPSARTLRKRLLKLRRKNEQVLQSYYSLGTSYSEPISSMMYSLASELGREDNDLLWMAIVGVTSMELYGRSSVGVAISTKKNTTSAGWLGSRGFRIRQLLRDEVRRLNPPDLPDSSFGSNRNTLPENNGVIPTTARSPTDTSIRLSPEPKFLLIRHWSLYDSMLHSPHLSARLHIWSENGRKLFHELLAMMGVSLVQCKQNYTHMDMELKRGLRTKLLKYSEKYELDMVPAADTDGSDRGGTKEGWGFVRSWGWRATLSAQDVGVVVGSILEVGNKAVKTLENGGWDRAGRDAKETTDEDGALEGEEWVGRFWDAYDALEQIEDLKAALPIAQHLHRAILRTGTALIEKRQIKHLRAFRMCVVKDGPDVALFTHPAALTKLALWIGEAIAEQVRESKGKLEHGGRGTPLVVAGLNESRGVYVIVGTGGGGGGSMGSGDRTSAKEQKDKRDAKAKAREIKKKEKEKLKEEKRAVRRLAAGDDDDEEDETESEGSDSSSDEDEDEEDEQSQAKGFGRNKFGNAFQEVIEETSARVRIDSFEHCVVEVKKDDLSGFLESLSMKAVVG
ncbi:hypothetical protein B7494_g135 [Chlorociboria aeruginascens]|nr:hypothetical protein B7494_g135 [Chlorociboria aeruginascens]